MRSHWGLALCLVYLVACGAGAGGEMPSGALEYEHPCDPSEDERPISRPADAPRCGDGVVDRHALACIERRSVGCGTEGTAPWTCCGGIVEQCDGQASNQKTCEKLGFARGKLGCRDCMFDTSSCRSCRPGAGVACGEMAEQGLRFVGVVGGRAMLATSDGTTLRVHTVTVEGDEIRTERTDEMSDALRLVVRDGQLWTYQTAETLTHINRLDGQTGGTLSAKCALSTLMWSEEGQWIGKLASSPYWRVIEASGECVLPTRVHVAADPRTKVTLVPSAGSVTIAGKPWPRSLNPTRGPFAISVGQDGTVQLWHGAERLHSGPAPVTFNIDGKDHHVARIEPPTSPFMRPGQAGSVWSVETASGRLWVSRGSSYDDHEMLRSLLQLPDDEADEAYRERQRSACAEEKPRLSVTGPLELAFVRGKTTP